MDKNIESFKEFVRNNSYLINYTKTGNKTWQDLYEIYDLYGEDTEAWNRYLNNDEKNTSTNTNNTKSTNYLEEMVRMAKNIDVDKVQEGITSLQKTLGLFSDLFASKSTTNNKEYNPRPLYRRFED